MDIDDGCFRIQTIADISRRLLAVLVSTISLLAHHHVGLSCFASLDALVPRVLECCVASCPAVSEPRTSTSAATEFAGFRDGATCEAYGADRRRRGSYCLNRGMMVKIEMQTL